MLAGTGSGAVYGRCALGGRELSETEPSADLKHQFLVQQLVLRLCLGKNLRTIPTGPGGRFRPAKRTIPGDCSYRLAAV